MVKLPFEDQREPGDEHYSQILHDFGILITHWQLFELAIEIKIARIAGLSPLYASIILGSSNAGQRQNVLYSLLSETGENDVSKKVKKLITFTRRNALIHGSMAFEKDYSKFDFYTREVKDQYVAKRVTFTADEFQKHLESFLDLLGEALDAMGVDEAAINEYGRAGRFAGLD